jgi:2-polyprenyl-3-methyl-5-hydroxy-6-metoxy-1,4-benzoquinol methylase
MGHHVTGVDVHEFPQAAERMSAFYRADLSQGIPPEVGTGFDLVLMADVLEHLGRPEDLIRQCQDVLAPEGSIILCVPNIGHWYPRARTVLGRFDYDQRGILDATHLRFFTRRSIAKLVERNGFTVRRMEAVGLPLDALGLEGTKGHLVRLIDHFLVTLWPTMFGYQFIVEATPRRY